MARGGAELLTTTYDRLRSWTRRWPAAPVQLGFACCAFEMLPALDRWDDDPGDVGLGRRELSTSPELSNLLLVAGTVSEKAAPLVRALWEQMPQPRWAVAMGACASCGGPYPTYAVTQGLDRVIPVAVYVSGCPPRAEALLLALLELEKQMAATERRR